MDFADQLNEAFDLGDGLIVLFGDDKLDRRGSFISACNNVLVWADHDGNVVFTNLGEGISVIKL
ncbi:MAG TPA: hypothetical protein VEY51_12485 [Chondromyces sp.]|nr:hypothetical protein [Chondromyces sp.]